MPETFTYKLVNPYIIGSMETNFKGGNSLEAANQAYKELSQYMGNSMPEFQFSLKRMSKDGRIVGGSENSFRHFQVHEKKEGGSNISYAISEIEMNPKVDIKHFQESLNKVAHQDAKLNGGAKKKYVKGNDYEDDDDDLSDYFDRADRPRKGPLVYEPISYYWYDPYIYPFTNKLYVPTFVLPIQPRVTFDMHTFGYLTGALGSLGYGYNVI
jgi:hypothetical protein